MSRFGSWSPDLGEFGHDGMVAARNVYPGFNGYEPVPGASPFTAALPEAWNGGGWFKGTDSDPLLLAGTAVAVYVLDGAGATSAVAAATSFPTFFAQFGDTVICTSGGVPNKVTLSTGVGAALGGTPPNAAYAAVVKDMVALAGGETEPANRVFNSALNDCEGWSIGTDQADYTDIPDGGPVTGLAGGENLRIFQDSCINIMEYVGGDDIFIRRKVSFSVGALCQGGIATLGGVDYFFHRSGFYRLLPGAEPEPIGAGKIDVTFRSTYSDAEIQTHLKVAVDPVNKRVIWSMPGRLWVFNTVTGFWSDIAITAIGGVTLGATAGLTLEQIAVLYPAIEDVPASFDDPMWDGGYPLLLIANSTDFKLYSLSGSSLAATLTMTRMEPFQGLWAHVRNARIIGDITTGLTVSIACRSRLGDSPTSVGSSVVRPNGDTPLRASGKFLQPSIQTEAGAVWTNIQGLDLEAAKGGRQ